MKIINRNIAEQTRGIYRRADGNGSEWRDIAPEKGSRQVLSDTEILELSELILKIEDHYGFPVDIEWVRENGKFYIVQSRPITTLSASVVLDCRSYLRSIAFQCYMCHNKGYEIR